MSAAATRVPAVGGTRTVPAPDPIARDYLLLGLRLDQRIDGLVDGYFGPAELKGQVETESLPSAARLQDDAASLLERVATADLADDRRAWLAAQIDALSAHAAIAGGADVPYVERVERFVGFMPTRRPDADGAAALAEIDRLLPGPGSVHERLDAWDASLVIPPDRVTPIVEWLVATFRARAATTFGLPPGEDLRVSLVRGQPWSGYNWYDGGLRSRVDLNLDLPIRASDLIHVVAHETYPGHHLEHAWKEADLVERQERLEASMLLINTPECLISEGLADVGATFAAPPAERADLLIELFARAGMAISDDPSAARATAERAVALLAPRQRLIALRGNAAYLRHADGWSHDEVLAYLQDVGGFAPAVAAQRLSFIEHPLWRTYVFVYAEGEALVSRWLAGASGEARTERFARLLHEQLTPSGLLAEVS